MTPEEIEKNRISKLCLCGRIFEATCSTCHGKFDRGKDRGAIKRRFQCIAS